MINLLAILLSFAMMLTGAPAPVDGSADFTARTLTLSNFRLFHNEQEVALNPSVTLGVMTDGAQSVYDFYINAGGERLLPLQLVADDGGLTILNDTSDTSLLITAEEIDAFVSSQLGDALKFDDAQSKQVFELMFGELIPAYGRLIAMSRDPEQMRRIQENADRVYDEIVDRGEGVPGEMEYDGRTIGMTTYNYTLDAKTLGRLADAVFASDEVLVDFSAAYFKLIGMADEESGFAGVDSFEALYDRSEIMMDVTESVTETGVTYQDVVMRVMAPDLDDPLEILVNSVTQADSQSAEASFELVSDGMTFEYYVESTREGDDFSGMIIVSGKAVSDDDETEPDADGAEDFEAPEEDVDDAPAEVDYGEGVDVSMLLTSESMEADSIDEDDLYFTVDFYSEQGEDANGYGTSMSVTVRDTLSLNIDLEGLGYADGTSDNRFGLYAESGEDTYSFSFDANIGVTPFEIRASAEDAVSIQDLNPATLLAGFSEDVAELTAEESVTRLIGILNPSDEPDEDEPTDDPRLEEGGDVVGEEPVGRSAEPYDDGQLSYGMPQLTWLPEGFHVSNIDVDTQYNSVSYEIDSDGGDSLYAYFNPSYHDSEVVNYVIGETGAEAVEGQLVTMTDYSGSRSFSMDDGTVSVNMYVYSEALSDEDILQMIAGIRF